MKTMRIPLAVLAVLTLGGTGFAATKLIVKATPASTPAITDPTFRSLMRLHEMGQGEIQVAELAKDHSSNDAVKTYAEKLIKDHTDADRTITADAKTKGWSFDGAQSAITAPEQVASAAEKAKLTALKGADFDREFLTQMVTDHDKVIALVADLKEHTNGQLHDDLSKIFDTVKEHRKMAHDLLNPVEKHDTAGHDVKK